MADGPATKAAILDVLADVSPSGQARSSALTVSLDWFQWLPAQAVRLFNAPGTGLYDPGTWWADDVQRRALGADPPVVTIERRLGERLAAVDTIRPGHERSLRVGWLFVTGRRPLDNGRTQRVLHPLLSVPVRVTVPPLVGEAAVKPAGDVALSDLIGGDRRHELETTYVLGGGALEGEREVEIPAALLRKLRRLHQFAMAAARAAGFEVARMVPVSGRPEELLKNETLTVVAGVALFTAGDAGGFSASESLRSWAARSTSSDDAFHALYLGSETPHPPPAGAEREVLAPFPLTPAQRRAVALTRTSSVSVVSGAAGNGKSHTVSAIACDAVARGESVLVAAKSEAAVDALLVLLGEAPGPAPVVFGSSERRDELARRLAAGELRVADGAALAAAEEALRATAAERDALAASIMVVDGGAIVQRGTHDELVGAPGLYGVLHRTQFGTTPEAPESNTTAP
ncbi:MAG: AAA family ATPase [Acidimicrobiales bacterium]